MRVGFTLAEALITLAVVGTVAAITLPSLIQNYKKKVTVDGLKTAYSIFSQAIERSKQENGDIAYWELPESNCYDYSFLDKYLLPYLEITKKITNFKENKIRKTFSNRNVSDWSWNSYPVFVLKNGMVFYAYYRWAQILITVDINGDKGPNIMGIDTFEFMANKGTNRLLPYGWNYSDDRILNVDNNEASCRREFDSYYSGRACATIIMRDGWKITDRYPWGNGGFNR